MTPIIIRAIKNVDMRNGHDGLKKVAADLKVNLDKLTEGELVVFLSNDETKLKLYGSGDVFAYYRSPRGRIQAEMIGKIPQSFGGTGKVNFSKAAESALKELLEKKHG